VAPVSLQPGDILLLYTATWNRFAGDKRYLTDSPAWANRPRSGLSAGG
jgi:hypothetical protein